MSNLILWLALLFPMSVKSYFLTRNTINPKNDRFVTVQEYHNQMMCTKKCSDKCYNFEALKWDEFSDDCYDCITTCSKKANTITISDVNFQLHNVSVCCPQYENHAATVTLRFSVQDPYVLNDAYIVWEYRISRGIEDFAPSPWLTVLQTRSVVANISGLVPNVSFQFQATLIDGEGECERAQTKWIVIEDDPTEYLQYEIIRKRQRRCC